MAKDFDNSLGDQRTLEGGALADTDSQSLGDQATQGDVSASAPARGNLDDLEIVDLSARYTIEGTLGQGGMGEVLLAFDTRLKRKVAIKRVLNELAGSGSALNRFLTEAQSIAALNHTNIVQIHDYGRDEDGPFLILEYVDGSNLQLRCQQGPLTLDDAIDLTCQLCDALSKAHEAGIIHRDIKPANILLTKDGIPKLTDFGLAHDEATDSDMTRMGTVLGTLDYMPPEQRRDAALTDARSDLWSLAATLYQMLTAKSPRVINVGALPQVLRDVIAKALDEEKKDRYQSAGHFRDALRLCLEDNNPGPIQIVDLGAGECAECHTRNLAERKFCSYCAAPLRTTCLQCEVEISVWEKVCGECGGNQPELVAARSKEMDKQRAEAEIICHQHHYDEAVALAKQINTIKHPRLQHLKEWSETFIESTQKEEQNCIKLANNKFADSQTHREAWDYPLAIQAIEAIPEPMRSKAVSNYLDKLRSEYEESEVLLKQISELTTHKDKTSGPLVRDGDLGDLQLHVTRAIELRGDLVNLRTLRKQVVKRLKELRPQRDASYKKAHQLASSGEARESLALIQPFGNPTNPSDKSLLRNLSEIVNKEDNLRELVASCKKDGVFEPREVMQMLDAALEHIELNPRHIKTLGLRDDLIKRIKRSPQEYIDYGLFVDRTVVRSFVGDLKATRLMCPVCGEKYKAQDLVKHHKRFHRQPIFLRLEDINNMNNLRFAKHVARFGRGLL